MDLLAEVLDVSYSSAMVKGNFANRTQTYFQAMYIHETDSGSPRSDHGHDGVMA